MESDMRAIVQFLGVLSIRLFVIVLCAFCATGFGQETSMTGLERKVTMKYVDVPFGTVVQELIEQTDVAIGFVQSTLDEDYVFPVNRRGNDCKAIVFPGGSKQDCPDAKFVRTRNTFSIDVQNQDLSVVLDAIVGQMGHYRWTESDGVINIVPLAGLDSRIEAFLRLNIADFKITPKMGRETPIFQDIRTSIFELPEVSEFIVSRGFLSSSARYPADMLGHPFVKDIKLSNVTMIDLLNTVVRVKRGGWMLRIGKIGPANQYLGLEI